MRVQKRNGAYEQVSFDKVLQRIRKAARGLAVHPDSLAQQVLTQIYDGVKTTELDDLTAQLAASLSTTHQDWGTLAAQIAISNHHKQTPTTFTQAIRALSTQVKSNTGEALSSISADLLSVVEQKGDEIDAAIVHSRDYEFDYFGFKTLEKSYLLKNAQGVVVERPQYLWMRVSLALWGRNLERAFETYDLLSRKIFTHATPTLFNAGTPRQQLSSCFLLSMHDDSIQGIFKTLSDCAAISKYAGGIGLHLHNVRARGSLIRGTNGSSNGLVPMLRVFNNTARYVDQCFTPDTIVHLKMEGGPVFQREIRSVKEGDMILTSKGYRRVNKAVSHWNKELMRTVKTRSCAYPMFPETAVRVTGQHPLLSVKLSGSSYEGTKAAYDAGIHVEEYREVNELAVGDFILGPSMRDEENAPYDWRRITAIEDTVYEGPVYDFEIDAPHDYYVGGLGFAHNGGGKRNGSFAMYLEPWHADVEDFLKLKLNTGAEEERARDLFYALWISDLFMERVEAGGDWSLFCPDEAPGLADCWGDEFRVLYTRYESEGRARKVVSAQKLWFQILDTQMETGTPYLLYKDAANGKSNQQNLGTIKSSNLCSEIIEYSSKDETAVCNLASLSLPAFVRDGAFDFTALRDATAVAARNLNRVIDINYYPTVETERSNMRHRPIGIGVQGLADVFAMLRYPWEGAAAADLNQRIFEHMYYAAASMSATLAEEEGAYSTFEGSPISQGRLQPDLWGVTPLTEVSGELDWAGLRERCKRGVRNSLLLAPMPTASTSQILGNNECFEPFTTNLYTRRTLAGEFIIVNKYLMRELMALGLWSDTMKQHIIARNGSVQGMDTIPEDIQAVYKTSWELKQRTLIDMAAARGAFLCQSQSLNLFVADPNYSKLTSMHFHAWKKGLKTGCYYLRTKAPIAAQKFTIDPRFLSAIQTLGGGGAAGVYEGDECDDVSEDEEEEADPVASAAAAAPAASQAEETPEQKKKREREEMKDRLAREYQEELARSKAAAEAGEGCLMCGS